MIARAREAGVEAFVTIGCDLATSQAAVALAEQHPFVYASIGVHPHEVKHILDSWYDDFRRLAQNQKVVAYGEIGLDYHYNHSSPKEQRERFREQIQLARELKLPVIIHTREAQDDTIAILKEETRVRSRRGVSLLFRGCVAGEGCAGLRVLPLVLRDSHVSERDDAPRHRQDRSIRPPPDRNRLPVPDTYPSSRQTKRTSLRVLRRAKAGGASRRYARHVGRDHRTHYDRERETPVQNRLSCRLRCRSALGNFRGFPRFSEPRFGRRSSPVSSSLWADAPVEFGPSRSFPTNS